MARSRLDCWLALAGGAWLVGLSVCAVGCLVSVDGLTGGGDAGRADAGDGGGGPDGTSDGPADSSLDSPQGRDSGKTSDSSAATDGAGPPDTGSGSGDACIPQEIDGGSPVQCPAVAPDAGACAPQPVPGFQPAWIPPRAPTPACNATQISTFIADCLGTTGGTACGTFQSDSANAACLTCMTSPYNATQTVDGPLLQGMNYLVLNIGGCISLTDPCQMSCAAAWEARQLCELASCGSVCPVTDDTSGAAYEACVNTADTCSCLPESTVALTCQSGLAGSPASECFPLSSFNAAAMTFATLFCGGGPGGGGDGG